MFQRRYKGADVEKPGMDADNSRGGENLSPRLRAAALGARIREQLAEMRAREVPKLEQLCVRLQTEISSWDNRPLAQSLRALYSNGRDLHFAQLRAGWLKRALGRHVAGFHRFSAVADRIATTAAGMVSQVASMSAAFAAHDQGVRRTFDELGTACKELGVQVDRAVTFLQQMCDDINRERVEGSVDRELATLAEAAQLYTQDLKRLQGIDAMVCDLDIRGKGILERRAALLEHLRTDMAGVARTWLDQVARLGAAAGTGRRRVPGVGEAIATHEDAMKRLEAALDACEALRGEEQFMEQQLEQLREALGGRH
jgi:hypothetical protein